MRSGLTQGNKVAHCLGAKCPIPSKSFRIAVQTVYFLSQAMQNIESVTPQRHILPHDAHISTGHKQVKLADQNEPLARGGVVSILGKGLVKV